MKLERTSGYNPFILNNRAINNIIFYNDDGILCETRNGWFGHSNNYMDSLEIGELVMSRSNTLDKNISKHRNTYITVTTTFDKNYDLYLYIDGENIKKISNTVKQDQIMSTKRRHYIDYVFEIFGKTVSFDYTTHYETTEFGIKVEETRKLLEDSGIKINDYDLQRLLKNFDLVKK